MLEKRLEVLLEPEEFDRLKAIAEARKQSIGELVRDALRRQVLGPTRSERAAAVRDLLSGDLDLAWPDWEEIENDMAQEVERDILAD